MKQAPRVWNLQFDEFLLKFGLTKSAEDPCVYFRHQQGELTILAIFVDDALICSNKKDVFQEITQHLEKQFQIRTMGADKFLGIDITRNRKERMLFASQPQFTSALLLKFGMQNCNPKATPADPHTNLTAQMSPGTQEEANAMKKVPYREAVGSLLYLATTTRPDIAYAVSQVSRFSHNPGNAHWSAVKRILAYLAGTTNYGLRFNLGSKPLLCYCDADWGRDLDKRRSTTGYIFINHGGPIVWGSRLQDCTAQSTTEAEYIAAAEATKEAIWLKRLLEELGQGNSTPVPLHCDNQGAIRLVKNPEFHKRTKHIDIKFHLIRDHFCKGVIDVVHVCSDDQLADFLTKPLDSVRFQALCRRVGILSINDATV